ncbi:MAG: polysaccharide biosynthesis tyrosine autokinase [Verrucomicrobiota bacterium]|jgi:capsular exopolysaccharide synthesis family protein
MPNADPLDLPPSPEPSVPGSVIDLHGVIRLVLDKAWLIVSCVLLAVVAAAVYVQRAPRIYEAVTTVQVEQEDAHVTTAAQVVDEDMQELDALNTVAQKLCNTALLQQVLETYHLLPPEGTFVTNGSKVLTREEVITGFARNVRSLLRRNTRLIDTSVRDTDPRLAARLANTLIEDYLQQDALVTLTTTTNASTYLQQEAERWKKKLEEAEQALADYRKQVGSVSLQEDQNIIAPKLQDLNKRLTQSTANLVQAGGAYTNSMKMSTNIEDLLAYPQVAADPDVMQVSTDVAKHENDFVLIRQRYREKHPKYIRATNELEGLKQQLAATAMKVRSRIQESLRIAYQDALTSQDGLEAQLHEAETEAKQLGDNAVRDNVLSREVDSAKAQFSAIINRLGETAVQEHIKPERIHVIQPALVPGMPASPRIKLIFALALLGGLAAGLGICFVLECVNTSFRTVDEAELHLALPVLGAIPKMPKTKVEGSKLVAIEDRNSPGAEVFRTLRTTLSMLGREQDRRTYLFTSSLPSEGKTFTSVNYAVSLAQQGLRTLLVDMDLRRPMLEEFFTGKRSVLLGVTDYFLGRKKFDELCLQNKEVAKLFWMPGGSTVPNPLELLTQSDVRQLLAEGLAQFDRIVIDTAPLLPVSDTLLLASRVQTVVLVVQGRKTSRKAVERSVQLLNKANAPIGGIVLNLLPNRRLNGYYYSYYHGYGYGHYGYGERKSDKTAVDA